MAYKSPVLEEHRSVPARRGPRPFPDAFRAARRPPRGAGTRASSRQSIPARALSRSRCAARGSIRLQRAYERRAANEGTRVLVDRLWPRGVRKDRLAVDFWLRELAPSAALRCWYGHDPARWPEFTARYRAELAQRQDLLHLLDRLRRRTGLTLLYGARDLARNNAVVLREVLQERHAKTDRPR